MQLGILIVMAAAVGVLVCSTRMSARWPDGGVSEAWTLAAGTPVWIDPDTVDSAVLRVYALDQRQVFADVPAGWVEPVERTGEAPF